MLLLNELYNKQEEERCAEDILFKVLLFIKRYPGCACEYCWRFKIDACSCEHPNIRCFEKLLEGKNFKDTCKLLWLLCLYSEAAGESGCEACWKALCDQEMCSAMAPTYTDNSYCYKLCLLKLDTDILDKRDRERARKYLERRDFRDHELVRSIQRSGLSTVTANLMQDPREP